MQETVNERDLNERDCEHTINTLLVKDQRSTRQMLALKSITFRKTSTSLPKAIKKYNFQKDQYLPPKATLVACSGPVLHDLIQENCQQLGFSKF